MVKFLNLHDYVYLKSRKKKYSLSHESMYISTCVTSAARKSNSGAHVYSMVWKLLKSENLLLKMSPMCSCK